MPITRVEVVAVRVSPPPELAALRALRGEWVFVLAHGDGFVGIGEATHSGDDDAVAAALRDWRPLLEPVQTCDDRVLATARSALEQASQDCAARIEGVPLHEQLGSRITAEARVALYATLNRGIFDRSPEGFAGAAKQAIREGFRAVKCAPFDGVAHGAAASVERAAAIDLGLERVAAVRAAVGSDVTLMLDGHGRFSEAEAVAVARRLEPFRLRWLEEPVPFWPDPAPLARVRREVAMPIAAGELMFGAEGFRPLLEAGAVDVVMPDVKHCGGVSAAREIAKLAADFGVLVAPHNPSGPISTLASAHLCAALPNAPLLEFAWGEVPWRSQLLSPPERVEDGALVIPGGPGLGAGLNRSALAEHACALPS